MTQITRAALLAVAAFTGTLVAAVADVPAGDHAAAGNKDTPCCECGAKAGAAGFDAPRAADESRAT